MFMRYALQEARRNPDACRNSRRVTAIQKINGLERCVILEREANGCYKEVDVKVPPATSEIRIPIPALYLG
jgi:hypothetical protein